MTYSEIMQAWRESAVWSVKSLTPYEQRKALARDLAIEWQYHWGEMPFDVWEDCKCRTFFENVGKRYGLLREFRENGII
jgi:hypothetical protein